MRSLIRYRQVTVEYEGKRKTFGVLSLNWNDAMEKATMIYKHPSRCRTMKADKGA